MAFTLQQTIEWAKEIKHKAAAAILLNQSVFENCDRFISQHEGNCNEVAKTSEVVAKASARREKFYARKLKTA